MWVQQGILIIPLILVWMQALLEPFTHISSVPGKDIRGQMLEAFNDWLNVPSDKLQIISKVINMLHNASLL
jgi:geranylgeranyl diphosphate synthase, type III